MQAQLRDRRLIYAAAFLRAISCGVIGVELGLYLAALDVAPGATGPVIGAGLSGVAAAAFFAAFFGDRWGRRRFLVVVSLLSTVGAAAAAFATDGALLGVAAFVGMLNGMGKDRGGSLILEQAMLPSTGGDQERTLVFARYNVLQDVGHAVGALVAALPKLLVTAFAFAPLEAHRMTFIVPAILGVAVALISLGLSREMEPQYPAKTKLVIAPESKKILTKISALFALDSLGSGFISSALMAYFFFQRFGAAEEIIAALFFVARILNALSHFGAAALAKRIGLVRTMVFTHLPSSILLLTVPFAPTFEIAALLFLLREGLVEMDVPTRQSYVLAVVRPEERSIASGVTNLVRMTAWAAGPFFGGPAMAALSMGTPLIIGASMKISYDLLLYRAFKAVKPPEER